MMNMNLQSLFRQSACILAVGSSFAGLPPASAEAVRCLTEPVRDVEMSSNVPGTIAEIHFGEGSFVEKDEVILELESTSEELDVQRRSVLAETLKNTFERSEMLLKNTSSISMEEVDEARSEYQMAVLELELAKEALNKKRIASPFSGIITDLPIEVGEYCEPPQILLRIVDPRRFYCVANIDPAVAAKLKEGDPVRFTPDPLGTEVMVEGRIVFISPVVDPASGLLRIKALFENNNNAIRPGEGGFVNLLPSE